MKRAIVAFQQDEVSDWVMLLHCGHHQHVRHDPPLSNRPWVLTAEGRQQFIGFLIECKFCDAEQNRINRKW
jgi:hypothetical protein